MFRYYGDQLTEYIDELCRRYRVPTHRTPLWAARRLASNPYFWRLSQKARRYFAEFNDVPTVLVQSHIRKGRQVREHFRLLGNAHLLALPLDEFDLVVGEVLKLIAEGKHHKRR